MIEHPQTDTDVDLDDECECDNSPCTVESNHCDMDAARLANRRDFWMLLAYGKRL